jgi:hypothetical protein
MNAPIRSLGFIKDLQRKQHAHDLKSHWEILCLPAGDRMKHMVLHFAKYAGKLMASQASRCPDNVVVDTFIIALASANALNVDLESRCVVALTGETPLGTSTTDLCRSLAIATGRMAKACEALDHIERFNSREELEAGIVAICKACVDFATANNLSLDDAVARRWREIESKQSL